VAAARPDGRLHAAQDIYSIFMATSPWLAHHFAREVPRTEAASSNVRPIRVRAGGRRSANRSRRCSFVRRAPQCMRPPRAGFAGRSRKGCEQRPELHRRCGNQTGYGRGRNGQHAAQIRRYSAERACPCDCRERRYGGSEHGRSRTASFLPSAGDERTTFLTSSWLHRGQMNVRSSNPGSGAWMAVIHSGQWQTGQGGRSMSSDAGRKSEPVSMPEPGSLGFRA